MLFYSRQIKVFFYFYIIQHEFISKYRYNKYINNKQTFIIYTYLSNGYLIYTNIKINRLI